MTLAEQKPGPTRTLAELRVRFQVIDPIRFNHEVFAGVCMAYGCEYVIAYSVARSLWLKGLRETSVRTGPGYPFNLEACQKACEMIGVRCEALP